MISAVAAPSATLKPANQISWSTWTVVVAADGSGAIDSTATDAAASDAAGACVAAALPPHAATEMASAPAIASAGSRRPVSPAVTRFRMMRTSWMQGGEVAEVTVS